MVRFAIFALLACGLGLGQAGLAPTPVESGESNVDLQTDVTVVTVPVGVSDSRHRPITGLKKEDFTLLDNGVKQQITSVSFDDDPIALCVVYDVSGSVGGNNRASWSLLQEVLKLAHPGDEVCAVTVASEARVAIPLTRDESREDADQKLFNVPGGGTTALLDGAYLAFDELKRSQLAKKAMVIVSDGLDNDSRYTEQEVLDVANESDALVYALRRSSASSKGVTDRYVLGDLSQATGGVVYRRESFIDQVISDLRNRYILTFSPAASAKNGRYHRLQVQVARPAKAPKRFVHARSGYYAVPR